MIYAGSVGNDTIFEEVRSPQSTIMGKRGQAEGSGRDATKGGLAGDWPATGRRLASREG